MEIQYYIQLGYIIRSDNVYIAVCSLLTCASHAGFLLTLVTDIVIRVDVFNNCTSVYRGKVISHLLWVLYYNIRIICCTMATRGIVHGFL